MAEAARGMGATKRVDAGPCVATTPSRLAAMAKCRLGRVLWRFAGNAGGPLDAANRGCSLERIC
jgi:hypothetical protein